MSAKHHLSLARLQNIGVGLLDWIEEIGRPLLTSERRAFRWVLMEWEAPHIKRAVRRLKGQQLDYCRQVMAGVQQAIQPDPVRQVRLQRAKPEAVAELNDGNFSVNAPPFRGVRVRRLTAAEANERVQLLARLAGGLGVLARELALVRSRDQAEARAIARLGQRLARLGREFVGRCRAAPAIPAERSIDEVMDEMEQLRRLMAPEADKGEGADEHGEACA